MKVGLCLSGRMVAKTIENKPRQGSHGIAGVLADPQEGPQGSWVIPRDYWWLLRRPEGILWILGNCWWILGGPLEDDQGMPWRSLRGILEGPLGIRGDPRGSHGIPWIPGDSTGDPWGILGGFGGSSSRGLQGLRVIFRESHFRGIPRDPLGSKIHS